MDEIRKTGRVTIPTDLDVVPETLEILKKWGADAIRDCDGTDFPQQLKDADAKIYSTYYTTRKDNAWAKANPDEVQQCYIMTGFYTAPGDTVTIPLMKGISPELMQVNTNDDITRWWEVMDRTTGQPVPPEQWSYADGSVTVQAVPFHEYTVSFLAYLIWDPVHMYNATTNGWTNFEHQITFDVRQPKTHKYSMERLRKFIAEHPYVNVIRYTTFFHQFTLIFDELKREKFVDWYGYSASVSPYILNQFEQEVGYKFRPEYIIDQGYYNNQYRVPSKEFRDFQAFQRREVAKLAKEMVDITHACGCEAMMFLGDHWIGTEPFMPEFKTIGLDAVVGSVGNGSTLRLISDIEGVKYTEGRFLPYFFPDTFHEGGDPVREAKENWVTARRAILRKPIDRIGYGGYLKLALQFPEFVDYVESVCNEFRELYENIKGTTPYCVKRVAVLNCWGKMRAWGCHMVHHALYYKQNYSYAGVIEMLSGAPFDVKFISFEDIKNDPHLLDSLDVIINVGDADTAHTGGIWWEDPEISSAIRKFVWNGGGFIGVGEPSGHPYQGHIFQLASCVGRGGRKRLHPELRQIQLGGAPRPLYLAGRRPTRGLWRGQEEYLCAGRHRSAGAAKQRSADGGTRLRQGSCRVHQRCALQFCQQPHPLPRYPVECPQRGGAAYMVQLQLQRGGARLRQKRQVLRGEQHLRAAGHHRLHHRRQQLCSASGCQRDQVV